jgi:hypothetical protein
MNRWIDYISSAVIRDSTSCARYTPKRMEMGILKASNAGVGFGIGIGFLFPYFDPDTDAEFDAEFF